MIRLGLCCIFYHQPIKFKVTSASYLRRIPHPYHHLSKIILHNFDMLKKAFEYCVKAGIGCFRLSSRFLPLCSDPDWKYQLDTLPHSQLILKKATSCKNYAQTHKLRLTLHPDPFTVLNSPRKEVTKNTIDTLNYQAYLAELLGIDVINIHAGGAYGNKKEALKRFLLHYKTLPLAIQSRLTIENDDKSYSPQDLLPICEKNAIPFVYDVHHHRCLKDGLTVSEVTKRALKTWNREPLFHLSSPLEGWHRPKPNRHHDYINVCDFPSEWEKLSNITIEIEAKAKELAIEKLKQDLAKKGLLL